MKYIYKGIGLLVVLATTSCGLIFEKSIKNSDLVVNSPADSSTTIKYSQQFKWEPVNDATRYRLQVYEKNFTSGIFVYDTTVTGTQLVLTFQPGEYAWRLRAENSGSETDFHNGMLYVKKGNFIEQMVTIVGPNVDYISTKSSIKFSWQKLYDAKKYILEIDTIIGDFSKPIISDTISNSLTEITKVISNRGDYWWRMKAISSTDEQTLYSSPQTFFYSMADISLLAPKNSDKVSAPISFSWSPIDNTKNYKLYIYKSDSVTTYSTQTVSTNSFSLNQDDIDLGKTYYWSVSAIDNNGFIGNSSKRIKFTVNP